MDLWQDVRYALRGMRRNPGFTAVAVLSLALGTGANSAIFSLLDAVLLRSLPVEKPGELVELLQKYPGEPRGNGYWTRKSYDHFREQTQTLSALAGTGMDYHARIQVPGSESGIGITESVTGNYFEMLGIRSPVGRLISGDDESVAVVSWPFWNSKFQQDPNIVGKHVIVQDVPLTIVGVAPRWFAGIRLEASPDLWLALPKAAQFGLIGRLKAGATMERARAEMAVLYRFTIEERMKRSSDPQLRQLKIELEPAGAGLATVRDRFGKILLVLMSLVGLLLLMACVNIASILLARGANREREMAVRVGLGASRGRLLRQVLTESAVLSVSGTLVGVVLSYWGADALIRILDSGRDHERIHLRIQPDLHLLVFAVGIATAASLFFGLAPALNAFRMAPVDALRQSVSSSGTLFQRWFGKGLAAAQVAFSVLLLSCGALFVTHLWNLENTDLGFRRDHVLLVRLDPPRNANTGQQAVGLYQELLDRLRQIPGVRSAALSSPTPLSGAGASGFGIVDGFEERPTDRRWISIARVSPKSFETLGVPLITGRDFTARDQGQPQVAIINKAMARYYFGQQSPLGKRITMYHVTMDPEARSYEIVGVVGDAHYAEIREEAKRTIYLPAFFNNRVSAENLVLRTTGDPNRVAGDVRRLVRAVLKTIPVAKINTLTEQIDASILPERLMATLSGFFGSLAVVLASVGLYGLLAYTVARRTNEIGIRLTLGATAADVTQMVTAETLAILAIGLALGVPLVLFGRALAAQLIQDPAADVTGPLAIGSVVIVVGACLASWIPAWRAAHVDPMVALRHE